MRSVLDMVVRDDECRVRKDRAPANFTIIKHIAADLLARARGKDSLRSKRKVAAWDDALLASLISQWKASPDCPAENLRMRNRLAAKPLRQCA
jgi:hypothetical protein